MVETLQQSFSQKIELKCSPTSATLSWRRENERIKSKEVLVEGVLKKRHIDVLRKIETMDDILNVSTHKK